MRVVCEKSNHGLLITGDFNADPKKTSYKSKSLDIFQTDYGLDQLCGVITRERVVQGILQQSTLDLVFVKDVSDPKVKAVKSEASDHYVVATSFKDTPKIKIKFQKKVVLDWRNFSAVALNKKLEEKLDEYDDGSSSTEVLNRNMENAISAAMNVAIPKRVVHLRRDSDIVSYKLEALKKKRDRLLKEARKTGCALILEKVKNLNLAVKKMVKSERDRIINNKLKNSSPTNFWSTVNGLLGRVMDTTLEIRDEKGNKLSDEMSAEGFANFFRGKVMGLMEKNPIQDNTPVLSDDPVEPFSEEEIEKAVASFKPKKSCGPDEVPMLVIKECFVTLKPFIKKLFERIVLEDVVPAPWKVARIKPIFKKGDESQIVNYRPISNLNSISKIFERCVLNRVISYDTDGPNQHGFRSGHSTVTAAVELQDAICEALDKKKLCLVYSVDLSAAFDLIRPGLFYEKASKVMPPGLARIIFNFISDRRAYVEVGQSTSCSFKLPIGCPQGSTLGPKVFSIYCGDLNEEFEEGFLVSFADDSYVLVTADNIQDLKMKAERTLRKHLQWLMKNGMICNIEKTEMMQLGTSEAISLTIDGKVINPQDTMKVLGIYFDNKMSWEKQAKNAVLRTNKMYHGLSKIRRHLNPQQRKQVVTAYYFSVLYYGCEAWLHRGLGFHLKQKVRSAHYRALRLIHGDRTRDELDMISGRATPDEWSDFCLAKMLARMAIEKTPRRLSEKTMLNSYQERRQLNRLFFYDNSERKIGRQCFKNRVGCIANQMKFEWLKYSPNALRPSLKKSFFKYAMKPSVIY